MPDAFMDKLHKSLQGWAKSRIIIFIVKRQGSGHCGWPIRYSEKQRKGCHFPARPDSSIAAAKRG